MGTTMVEKILVAAFMLVTMLPTGVWSAEEKDDNSVMTYRQVDGPVICIDQVDKTEMIINDTLFYLTDQTRFFDREGARASSSRFKQGVCVKVIRDSENKLLELYEALDEEVNEFAILSAQESKDGERSNAPAKPPKKETIILEDGVWKN